MTVPNTISDWRSIPALGERINEGLKKPSFTEHALRHLVKQAAVNGLDDAGAIRRIGRKVLISETLFLQWLNNRPAHRKAA